MIKSIDKVDIFLSSNNYWKVTSKNKNTVWFKGYLYNMPITDLVKQIVEQDSDTIKSFLNTLDGHFSLIVKTPKFYLIAVDKIRSIPIIWAIKNKNNILISDQGQYLNKELKLKSSDIDYSISNAFAISGYTIGDNTLYSNVKQVSPGNYLWLENKKVTIKRYYIWQPWSALEYRVNLSSKLNKINKNIFKKLIDSVNNRQIVVPLSGGLDSRLVLAGLKKYNYKNVLCISYGLKNNKDAYIAKKVADKLGYKWIFIEYSNKEFRKHYYSEEYKKYTNFCDTFTSIHFIGEYIMLSKLSNNLVEKDAIFINGQSGDFISGNHIPSNLDVKKEYSDKQKEKLFSTYLVKHYKHWNILKNKDNLDKVENLLSEEINKIGGFPSDQNKNYGIYEYMEFMDRQSKYVVNGQRNYEYFGYEWRLPLWDNEYIDFWEKVPLKYKINQTLYKDTLIKYNWGNVWQEININPLKISPKWIIPIRFIFKLFFIFHGKNKWHKYENKYLAYFMSNLVEYAPWSYFQIIFDKRGHENAIGWLIEDYLKYKGLNWKGNKP